MYPKTNSSHQPQGLKITRQRTNKKISLKQRAKTDSLLKLSLVKAFRKKTTRQVFGLLDVKNDQQLKPISR